MKTIYVTPKEGYSIFDPVQRTWLPPTGRLVVDDLYWNRMARDGDVVVTEPPNSEGTEGAKS